MGHMENFRLREDRMFVYLAFMEMNDPGGAYRASEDIFT